MIALLLLFVKSIFGVIDRMVAFVIQYLYQLIVAIADTNVFGNVIYHYLGRIYTFLGIFMVFKLSISMINYIINPDALTDKSKGFGKLISNVIISLILLVATPTLFNVAFDIQADILNSNALYQIVTGRKIKVANTGEQQNTMMENAKINGKTIAYGVYSAVIYDNKVSDSTKDSDMYEKDSNGKNTVIVNCDSDDDECPSSGKCPYGSVDCLLAPGTITHENNTYWWLLSTIIGIAVAYILLTFCLDVAVRSVKLGFLQIIAPIPIMMRMDPGAKDDKFSKWLKEVSSTFLSLFIRLAGLFFVIEIIRLIMNPEPGTNMMTPYSEPEALLGGGGLTGLFVRLFIIIGCLMFAKKLPQLISDLFGIKLDGDGFSLKKKMGNIPGLGAAKVLGAGALGFAGGAAANAYAGIRGWDKNKGFWSNMNKLGNSTLTGGLSGGFRGATSKEKNLFKATGAGITGSAAARNLRADRIATGEGGIGGWFDRRVAGINSLAGITDDDTAKIAAKRKLGDDLFQKYSDREAKDGQPARKGLKYSMDGAIGDEFGKAWKRTDDAKDYRNAINKQLSIAKSDFQAGNEVSWNGKSGAEAIAALEIESAKASAAYDKASADFKELRSMKEHKAEATYYDAFNYADDLNSASTYASKTVENVSSVPASSVPSGDSGSSRVKVTPRKVNR